MENARDSTSLRNAKALLEEVCLIEQHCIASPDDTEAVDKAEESDEDPTDVTDGDTIPSDDEWAGFTDPLEWFAGLLTDVMTNVEGEDVGSTGDATPQISVSRILDESDKKCSLFYCDTSPVVATHFWVRFPKVSLEAVFLALWEKARRADWDPESELEGLTQPDPTDVTGEHDFRFVFRCPWPFWDRELLQRSWQLPLPSGGRAIVLQSFDDEARYPRKPDRIRAVTHKAAYLFRPVAGEEGVDLTVVWQLDIGGVIPSWAHSMIAQRVVWKAESWAESLREYCMRTWPTDLCQAERVEPLTRMSREQVARNLLEDLLKTEIQCHSRKVFTEVGCIPFHSRSVGPQVVRIIDEADRMYCLIQTAEGPVTVFVWARLRGAPLEVAFNALWDKAERSVWDKDSEFEVLSPDALGHMDVTHEQTVRWVPKLPFLFWQREAFLRCWQIPLRDRRGGKAMVMHSFDDCAARKFQVQIPRSGFLLRSPEVSGADSVAGFEITMSFQMDLGGHIPSWAQTLYQRSAVRQTFRWLECLRNHCVHRAGVVPAPDAPPVTGFSDDPEELLHAVMGITDRCAKAVAGHDQDGHEAYRLVDEEFRTFWALYDPHSSQVIFVQRLLMWGASAEDATTSLWSKDHRPVWDPCVEIIEDDDSSNYHVLRVVLEAPWPLDNRELLQHCWRMPLPADGERAHGTALVMRSFADEERFPVAPGCTRAFTQVSAQMVRPLPPRDDRPEEGVGFEVTLVAHVDLGCYVPRWILTKLSVARGLIWVQGLRDHARSLPT